MRAQWYEGTGLDANPVAPDLLVRRLYISRSCGSAHTRRDLLCPQSARNSRSIARTYFQAADIRIYRGPTAGTGLVKRNFRASGKLSSVSVTTDVPGALIQSFSIAVRAASTSRPPLTFIE